MKSARRNRTRLPIWAAVFMAMICVAILGLSGRREWSSRDAESKNAELDMANLAESLKQHADDTFELVDNVLIGLVNRLEIDGFGPEGVARLQAFLDLRRPSLGRIRGLFVYDASGEWLATTADVSLKGFNNGDRDYFLHHAQTDDRRTLIGPPVRSRSGGQSIITISRRANHSDGSFAGVVLATVDVAYSSSSTSAKKGAVGILSSDGIGGASVTMPADANSYPALVEAADQALYYAKESGRDRFVMSDRVRGWPGAICFSVI